MRDGKLFQYVCVFTGIFGVRKVLCYLSVQVTVLLEMIYIMKTVPIGDDNAEFIMKMLSNHYFLRKKY